MESSCGMWWIDGTVLGNGDGFFHQPKGGIIGGWPSIVVELAVFSSVVAAWWRESSRRQSLPRMRVVPK